MVRLHVAAVFNEYFSPRRWRRFPILALPAEYLQIRGYLAGRMLFHVHCDRNCVCTVLMIFPFAYRL